MFCRLHLPTGRVVRVTKRYKNVGYCTSYVHTASQKSSLTSEIPCCHLLYDQTCKTDTRIKVAHEQFKISVLFIMIKMVAKFYLLPFPALQYRCFKHLHKRIKRSPPPQCLCSQNVQPWLPRMPLKASFLGTCFVQWYPGFLKPEKWKTDSWTPDQTSTWQQHGPLPKAQEPTDFGPICSPHSLWCEPDRKAWVISQITWLQTEISNPEKQALQEPRGAQGA